MSADRFYPAIRVYDQDGLSRGTLHLFPNKDKRRTRPIGQRKAGQTNAVKSLLKRLERQGIK